MGRMGMGVGGIEVGRRGRVVGERDRHAFEMRERRVAPPGCGTTMHLKEKERGGSRLWAAEPPCI